MGNGQRRQCGLTATKAATKEIKKATRRRNGIPPGAIQQKHELKAIVIPPKSHDITK